MFDPISTYRIQFHKDFTFSDFRAAIPYLHRLGIKTIYASPIYQAVPGSMHGYDVVNPNRINSEIGTIDQLREISVLLKEAGMSWIQDIVPNHMGFHQHNEWLMDVLKKGGKSAYLTYFDLISTDLDKEPLMVPFLGDDLDNVIANGELELVDNNKGRFLKYYENHWPVREDIDLKGLEVGAVAQQQYYRLCCHRETNTTINYRRFFTVNSLICLNVQNQEVFSDYHGLTKSLIDEGIFQGLRIDHVDGLADPTAYMEQLRQLCGPEIYIVVEKILEPGEELPTSWPVQGTTGYDYLGMVNQLFTNDKAERNFDAFYKNLGRHTNEVQQLILKKKRTILDCYMQGELENLYQLLVSLKLLDRQPDDEEASIFKAVISEILVRCPVYRFYSNQYPLLPEDLSALNKILEDIADAAPEYTQVLEVFRRRVFADQTCGPEQAEKVLVFFKRLMQFTGPLMAKGVEDTLMYTYNRFIGNNEVGDSPEIFGIRVDDFHDQIAMRHKSWPVTMNTTATHDTKRGEDARTRLTVLTDLRKEWIAEVKEWRQLNKAMKGDAPDANDEYFIYQTLIATYPEGNAAAEQYQERLLAYIEKALRESKRNSEWDEPDLEYEAKTKEFISSLLNPNGKFWSRFSSFHQKVAALGRTASLTSLVLKHTLPGVPDTYQGTELWDLSMVDPDNRRPVDYQHRAALLVDLSAGETDLEELWIHGSNGQIKLFLLHLLLKMRQSQPDLFSKGLYLPIKVKGKYSENVIAFARRHQDHWLVVALPVNLPSDATEFDWEDTRIMLPEGLPNVYTDVLHNEEGDVTKGMKLSRLFSILPMAALLFERQERGRGAGVLMHVSSLPSAYGIGDFGPAARQFINFLADAGLKYWQVLPMNPISRGQEYSPYSATSVIAGNTLLISPEDLFEEGMISKTELKAHKRKIKRNVSYSMVSELKSDLLKKAYQTWRSGNVASTSMSDFKDFCVQEQHWLNDYALYQLIGEMQGGKPWLEWPVKFRDRHAKALSALIDSYTGRLDEIKWQQYLFFRQWSRLRAHATTLGVKLIGDLPFYTALDSADVWTYRKLFSVERDGRVKGIAGVPPDYFNAEGQLWGMPVYDWQAMKRAGYKWWVDRLAKNFELYDLIRLDHFRAFASYWEVPAGSDTAKNGVWKTGPGADFFKAMLSTFNRLPMIAEDLGEITTDVYDLRDKFNLPGMKVLQFAFGEDIGRSIHAPHNFAHTNCIVYTGTHDNNTTRGWYEEEVDNDTKRRMEEYLGAKVTSHSAAKQLIRVALSSIADIAIIPMQDLLNKPAKSRMNIPASLTGNWTWRLKPGELKAGLSDEIRRYVELYGR